MDAERKKQSHIAVLDDDFRWDTDVATGLIDLAAIRRQLDPQYRPVFDFLSYTSLDLGTERPFYEVTFDGRIYRGLFRPVAGREGGELIRCWAPGLRSDGWLLDAPAAIPNTPRALLAEIQALTHADAGSILTGACSILYYRRQHGARYPDVLDPAAYRFDVVFLMQCDTDGHVSTLYETPKGVNPELWTMFLTVLDRPGDHAKLIRYVLSSQAIVDFGERGARAMRDALRLRGLGIGEKPSIFGSSPFLSLFPTFAERTLARNVFASRA
jgi:hypothetical protein